MKILEISLARQMGGGDKALGHNNHHDYFFISAVTQPRNNLGDSARTRFKSPGGVTVTLT